MGGPTSSLDGLTQDINVLPLIDVLLVLLIVFFLMAKNLIFIPTQVPEPTAPGAQGGDGSQLVLELRAGGSFTLNGQAIPADQLEQQLRSVFKDRPKKLLFIKAADDRPYQDVISAMDVARGAGVEMLAIVPRKGSPR
jgi:biopolymer transport protein ExbD